MSVSPSPRPSRKAAPAPRGRRLAAIDVGSNSIHMIVVEAEPGGGYRVLDREREMVRLGKSALSKGILSERAVADGLLTLRKMSTLARLKGAQRILAVATSAVREAENGAEFLARVKAQTGLEPRILDGEEEGRLIYRAVREAVDLGRGRSLILDIGGGSTEWITTRGGRLSKVSSFRLGSLRCAGWLADDPPADRDLRRLRERIREALRRLPRPRALDRVIATSGTAVCCADLIDFLAGADWKASGAVAREVRTRDLRQLIEHLAPLRRRQIAALPPVGGPRAESILAGAILLDEMLRHAGASRFQVSDRALREGLVLDALGQPLPETSAPADVRRRQIEKLAERAPGVQAHGEQCARLATRLFDLTLALHGLGPREREWLEQAARLHDLGYLIDYHQHHKHGYYMVTSATLDAFDQREIEILAHLVRYHRGADPSPKHESFAALKPWQQRTIVQLTALLRVADALDRSHARRVEEIYCSIRKKTVEIDVLSRWDVSLELDTAQERGALFEEVFGRKLKLRRGLRRGR